jgi:hypothetical protein
MVASPEGVEREGTEGGVDRMILLDLALFANLKKLYQRSFDIFSIASLKLCLLAVLIAAHLALLALRYSCLVSSVRFLFCLLRVLLAYSTSSFMSSDHYGTRQGSGFDKGTCWSMASLPKK